MADSLPPTRASNRPVASHGRRMHENHVEESAGSSLVRLSICITTFNRSAFLGDTLDSMLSQLDDDCEIVILDGGSTDDTRQVVAEYERRSRRVRYIRQEENRGFDRDCDRVVELARGEFCWLMTDDDLLKDGAVSAVKGACQADVSMIIVNAEDRDVGMSRVLRARWLEFETDRVYGPEELDRLFVEVGEVLMYVGSIVIRREIWLGRERQRYFGTSFVFVGIIFQTPLPGKAIVMAQPFISYRRGNSHSWSPRLIEIVGISWPSLVASLHLHESTKASVRATELWSDPLTLLLWRGLGCYSLAEYRRWIRPRLLSRRSAFIPLLVAVLPGVWVNAMLMVYFSVRKRPYRRIWSPEVLLEELKVSPFHLKGRRFVRPLS